MRTFRGGDRGGVMGSLRIRVAVPAALLAAGWAVACGGESSARQDAGAVHACALLTAAEVAEAVGQTPGAQVQNTPGENYGECRWPSADSSELLVFVSYSRLNDVRNYDEWVEQFKQAVGEPFSESDLEIFERVGGIGDFALFNDNGAMLGSQVLVYQGERRLTVGTFGVRGATNRDATLGLARKAWARLP